MQPKERPGAFQVLLVALSFYVLAALFVEVAIPLNVATRAILLHVDSAICLVFIYDFFHRLVRAENKLTFLKWGWIDLISSVPAVPLLRIGRAVRIVRVLRLLRGVRSVKTIEVTLFANRAKGTLASALFACTLLVVFASIAILHVEIDSTSNIKSPEDALWWSVSTVTTVGYGDRFPTTTEGRVIGIALMCAGVGLFAVLAASFAAWFMNSAKPSESPDQTVSEQLRMLAEETNAIRRRLDAAEFAALRARAHDHDQPVSS